MKIVYLAAAAFVTCICGCSCEETGESDDGGGADRATCVGDECTGGDAAKGDTGGGDHSGPSDAAHDGASPDANAGDAAGGDGGQGPLCGSTFCTPGQVCEYETCHPDCGTNARCGLPEKCCGPGQVCYLDACATPGNDCTTSLQCAKDQYCEPSLGKCLPKGSGGCSYTPTADFEPELLWAWTGSTTAPTYIQVMMTPVVVPCQDTNGDGKYDAQDIPCIIFNTFITGGSSQEVAVLRALSGDDGHELWTMADPQYSVNGLSEIAVGDLDGDGAIEIVTGKYKADGGANGGLIAFRRDGSFYWQSDEAIVVNWGGASIADLDGDGLPEVIIGSTVLDGRTGQTRWAGGACVGSNGPGPLSTVADINLDGQPEVVTGCAAYAYDGTVLWNNGLTDGFVAVANLTGDTHPEIVVVSKGNVRVQDWQGNVIGGPLAILGSKGGGPPTIADFDGDGTPEFGAAGSDSYAMYKMDAQGTLSMIWNMKTQDHSSNVTGSSVFDFTGARKPSVLYGDECYLHVFDGATGTEIFSKPNSSGTTYENPVVADVNGDWKAEIVVAANNYASGLVCPWGTHGAAGLHGIQVFKDKKDNWVPTRAIWNEHAYHVTNVNDDGSIPPVEPHNWDVPGMNNFRVNQQGEGLFNAPDLVARDPGARIYGCPPVLSTWVRVANAGSLGVPAGIPVAFYAKGAGTGGADLLLGVVKTKKRLLPGESEVIGLSLPLPDPLKGTIAAIFAVADDDGTGQGTKNECHEDNNASPVVPVTYDAGKEVCNGIDDTCNGEVDEDPDLCPATFKCVHGECVDHCRSGECPNGRVCVNGYCVLDGECATKDCPVGKVCIRSICMSTCTQQADCPQGVPCTSGVCYVQ